MSGCSSAVIMKFRCAAVAAAKAVTAAAVIPCWHRLGDVPFIQPFQSEVFQPPLPESFLAHGGGGQDTRQTPPPTSVRLPRTRLSVLPHHPVCFAILFLLLTPPSFFSFYILCSHQSPLFFASFFLDPFICVLLRPALAGLMPQFSMQSWPTPM